MERELIAACLVSPQAIMNAGQIVTIADFSDKDLGIFFDVLYTLHEAGKSTDNIPLLMGSLKSRGVSQGVRNAAYIADMIQNSLPHHAKYFAIQIANSSAVRKQQAILNDALSRLNASEANAAEVASWLEPHLHAAMQQHTSSTLHVGEVAKVLMSELRKAQERGVEGACTGIYTFDRIFGKFRSGELVILAARPGIGKTSFAAQIANNNAQAGNGVWFASLEMQLTEVVERLACGKANVDGRKLRNGQATEQDLNAIQATCNELSESDFWLWKKPYTTLKALKAEARLQAARKPISLIVVDYLGRIVPEDRRKPLRESIGDHCKALRDLGCELNCPVLCLAQLNREGDEQPKLTNLKDSGDIEADADWVIFLHHNVPLAEQGNPYTVLCDVAKNRFGPKGAIELEFRPKQTMFVDPSEPKREHAFDAFNTRTEAASEF